MGTRQTKVAKDETVFLGVSNGTVFSGAASDPGQTSFRCPLSDTIGAISSSSGGSSTSQKGTTQEGTNHDSTTQDSTISSGTGSDFATTLKGAAAVINNARKKDAARKDKDKECSRWHRSSKNRASSGSRSHLDRSSNKEDKHNDPLRHHSIRNDTNRVHKSSSSKRNHNHKSKSIDKSKKKSATIPTKLKLNPPRPHEAPAALPTQPNMLNAMPSLYGFDEFLAELDGIDTAMQPSSSGIAPTTLPPFPAPLPNLLVPSPPREYLSSTFSRAAAARSQNDGDSDSNALPGMTPYMRGDGWGQIRGYWRRHLHRQVKESRSVRAWEEEEVGEEDFKFFDKTEGGEGEGEGDSTIADEDGDVDFVGETKK